MTMNRLLCFFLFGLVSLQGQAAVYYVSTNGTDGANNGLTWGTAFKTISNGVAHAALSGDEVVVSNGTYILTTALFVSNAISLKGDQGAAATIVSANGGSRCLNLSNANAVVTGFTFTRANTTAGIGAGVHCYNGLLSSCVVTGNVAANGGGSAGGGGVYLVNGVVSNCDIAFNTSFHGGGVRITGSGLLTHSRIFNNTCDANGSAVTLSSGTMRNCLVYRNYAVGGVAVPMASGSVMQNCTVTENRIPGNAARTVSAVSGGTGCTLVNTIIRDNIYTLYAPTNFGGAVSATNCCLEFPWPGNGNIVTNPLFLKPSVADYTLAADSPCVNTGTNQAWMTSAVDFAGNVRIRDERVDIGACEAAAPLACGVQCEPRTGLAPLTVTLTALFAGADTNDLYYRWSYTNSAVVDEEGADKRIVSRAYDAGFHTITLTVSNGAGQTAVNDYLLKVSAPTVYVARAGSNTSRYPYSTWGTAASNIQDGVNAAVPGATVLLSNGTWMIGADVMLTNAITVTSLNGPSATIISSSTRAFFVDHPGAIVDGFFLRHTGQYSGIGNVVYLRFGTVRNCFLTGGNLNSGGSGTGGAGAFVLYGMISNCTVYANLNTGSGGAGIRVGAGSSTVAIGYTPLITHSILRNNTNNTTTSYAIGGGAYLDAGTIRNCLIVGNSSSMGGSGVILNGAGTTMENCTVSGNSCPGNNSAAHPGALSPQNGTVVLNSICRENTYTVVAPTSFGSATTPSIKYSDLEFPWTGAGNLNADPGFMDPAATNYRLSDSSVCIGTGSNQAWMTAAVDLASQTRINEGTVDMGAYEFSLGPLIASIGASPERGLAPLPVTFTATVSGQNTNGLYYWWSFTNAAVVDAEGADKQTVMNVFEPGTPVVRLTVSNSVGEVVQAVLNLKIAAPTSYVARLGWNTSTFPYADWSTAASSLVDAVDASLAGGVVLITNGNYALTKQVTVAEAIQVRSVNGAAETTVDGGGARRCFLLASPGALLQGLTIIRGNHDQGAGVYLEYGTVADCVVTGCVGTAGGSMAGGPVYVVYGTLTNCYLARNTGADWGGAIRLYQAAGLVTHCTIVSNRVINATGSGGGVHMDNGRMRNCLVFGNSSLYLAGGVNMGAGGNLENCTVVGNTSSGNNGPAVATASGSRVLNSIIWGNVYTNATPSSFAGSPIITYTLTEFPWSGDGNTSADPLFRNPAAGDFSFQAGSPCYNAGSNAAWMTEGAVDLAGNRRVVGSRVDLGAYERQSTSGTMIWLR